MTRITRPLLLGSVLGLCLATALGTSATAAIQCWGSDALVCKSGHQRDVADVVENYGDWQVQHLTNGRYVAEYLGDNYDIWLSFYDEDTINISLWVQTNTPNVTIVSGDTNVHLSNLAQKETGAFFDGPVSGNDARIITTQWAKEVPAFIVIGGEQPQRLPMAGLKDALKEIYRHRGKGSSPAGQGLAAATTVPSTLSSVSRQAEADMSCKAWNAAPKELGQSQEQINRLATVLHLVGDDENIAKIGGEDPGKGLAYARGYVFDITAACKKHLNWNMRDVAQAIYTHTPGQDW